MAKKYSSREKVAWKRINELFLKAKNHAKKEADVAKEMVRLAVRIKEKYNLSFSREQKLRYCKKCFTYFHDDNKRYRLREGKIVLTCKECGYVKRFSYK